MVFGEWPKPGVPLRRALCPVDAVVSPEPHGHFNAVFLFFNPCFQACMRFINLLLPRSEGKLLAI